MKRSGSLTSTLESSVMKIRCFYRTRINNSILLPAAACFVMKPIELAIKMANSSVWSNRILGTIVGHSFSQPVSTSYEKADNAISINRYWSICSQFFKQDKLIQKFLVVLELFFLQFEEVGVVVFYRFSSQLEVEYWFSIGPFFLPDPVCL